MPILDWLNKGEAVRTAKQVAYRLLLTRWANTLLLTLCSRSLDAENISKL